MSARTHVACLNLAPWTLTLVQRQQPGVPAAVLGEGSRRVTHACPLARAAGVQPGMLESAALSRCPELHAAVVTGVALQAAWAELLEGLYARFSDRVEGRVPGLAFLKVTPAAAAELASALHAPVGLARSVEVAHLAARRAAAGTVKAVLDDGAEQVFLSLTPLADLGVLGVTDAQVAHLRFMGVTGLADLLKWSAAQREAFLGVQDGRRLARFVKGERTVQVARYVPGQVLEVSCALNAPLLEPGEAQAALTDLVPALLNSLQGKTAAYLTVKAVTLGGTLETSRKLKWPLDAGGLTGLALHALLDCGALALGVDALRVQLSGLQQPARLVGLWAGVAELEVTTQVLERFPQALVRVRWLDELAFVADARYEWVDWLTGAARPARLVSCRPPRPGRPVSPPPVSHAEAVGRILAHFEGVLP